MKAETVHVVTSSEGGIWNMVVGVGIAAVIIGVACLIARFTT